MRKKYKNMKSNLLIIVSLGFFLYFVFVALGGGNDNSKVWVLAKHEVESRLKSPSSAKFPSQSEANISEVGDKYIVKSYVDAENSFGASIRNKFTVTLRKNSSGKYIVESVNIE
jgi:hypothetical protein